MQHPGGVTTVADVIALLEERAAFLRANLAAGCLPSLQQMSTFLGTFSTQHISHERCADAGGNRVGGAGTLAAQTASWATQPSTPPEQRNGLMQMFMSLHWDCILNVPLSNMPPPLPAAVLDALVRQRWELDRVLKQQMQRSQRRRQPDDNGPSRKRRREDPRLGDVRRGIPPVFSEVARSGSPPAVLVVFDLNGTVLTRRRCR